jgi:hypothetical protein
MAAGAIEPRSGASNKKETSMRATPVRAAPVIALLAMLSGCAGDDPVEPVADVEFAAGSQLAAPSELSAAAVTGTRIDLAWRDNSTSETGFELYRSAGETTPFGVPSLVGPNTKAVAVEGLVPGSRYCFKLRAIRRLGAKTTTSAFSNTACATTVAPPAPPLPSVQALEVIPYTSTNVWMRWGTHLAYSRVERFRDGDAGWVTIATFDPNNGIAYDSGLVSDQQVCYRIVAYNDGGEAAPSAPDCTAPPAAPTGLVATLRADGLVDLRWNDNSVVEDGYEVTMVYVPDSDCDINQGCYGDDYPIAGLPAGATSYTCGEVCVNRPVYVKAKKDGGRSDASNYVQVP